jgi:uncharacterized protein (DUF486 family)
MIIIQSLQKYRIYSPNALENAEICNKLYFKMLQELIVLLIVVAASTYLLRKVFPKKLGKEDKAGCDKCGE